MQSEISNDQGESLPRFFIKIDTPVKIVAYKIASELEAAQKHNDRPKAITIYASGQAIETAIKVSNEICSKFPEGLHRTTNSVLHITDFGETLGKENILDKEKLGWLMRGELGVKEQTCE
jgi:hypothetical protein